MVNTHFCLLLEFVLPEMQKERKETHPRLLKEPSLNPSPMRTHVCLSPALQVKLMGLLPVQCLEPCLRFSKGIDSCNASCSPPSHFVSWSASTVSPLRSVRIIYQLTLRVVPTVAEIIVGPLPQLALEPWQKISLVKKPECQEQKCEVRTVRRS